MDDTKTPFLTEEACSSPDSDYAYTEKHQDAPLHPELRKTWNISNRTKRAFKIALVIWLGVAFVTYFAVLKGGCSQHRKPEVTVMEGHIPGGGVMGGGGGSGKLGYKVVEDLPKKLIPQPGGYWQDGNGRRLIFVGDVHGSYRPLKALLKKLKYDASKDHIVLLGDMITRGNKSLEVLNLAMSEGASCVRGNHEDRILLLRKQLDKNPKSFSNIRKTSDKLKSEIKLARKLTEDQVKWLESCPVILNVSNVPGMGHIAAVHAGLRVGVPLAKQDPVHVMNMRSIDPKTGIPTSEKSHSKHHWANYWNRAQKQLRHPTTVVYGHFAGAGLDIRRYTMGLDSDCNRGGRLSALVVDSTKERGEVVQVNCRKLADKQADEEVRE